MDNVAEEQIIFKNILENPVYYKDIKKGFFTNKTFGNLIMVAKRFYEKYNESPSREQMLALLHSNDIDIQDNIVTALYDVDITTYDRVWLKKVTETFIKVKNLEKRFLEAGEILKTTAIDVDNIDEVTDKVVETLQSSKEINFNFNEGLDYYDAISHYQDRNRKIPSGYRYIDSLLGGYDEKTLVCYVGQANIGKCVCKDTMIEVRNKNTGETMEISIENFYKKLRNGQK